jgi:hypothetical protein
VLLFQHVCAVSKLEPICAERNFVAIKRTVESANMNMKNMLADNVIHLFHGKYMFRFTLSDVAVGLY